MNDEHAEQPKLCKQCRLQVLEHKPLHAEPFTRDVYCPHTGTHAEVGIKDGLIVYWVLRGPLLLAEAEQLSNRKRRESAALSDTVN